MQARHQGDAEMSGASGSPPRRGENLKGVLKEFLDRRFWNLGSAKLVSALEKGGPTSLPGLFEFASGFLGGLFWQGRRSKLLEAVIVQGLVDGKKFSVEYLVEVIEHEGFSGLLYLEQLSQFLALISYTVSLTQVQEACEQDNLSDNLQKFRVDVEACRGLVMGEGDVEVWLEYFSVIAAAIYPTLHDVEALLERAGQATGAEYSKIQLNLLRGIEDIASIFFKNVSITKGVNFMHLVTRDSPLWQKALELGEQNKAASETYGKYLQDSFGCTAILLVGPSTKPVKVFENFFIPLCEPNQELIFPGAPQTVATSRPHLFLPRDEFLEKHWPDGASNHTKKKLVKAMQKSKLEACVSLPVTSLTTDQIIGVVNINSTESFVKDERQLERVQEILSPLLNLIGWVESIRHATAQMRHPPA